MPANTEEDQAMQAIATMESLSTEQTQSLDAINQILKSSEPFVDVHELFAHYNVLYFRGLLLPRVEVSWSSRLTLCAGVCELSKDPTTGKWTRVRLKLSASLLQYRPRSDTINTLLHEAIHAYFFVTTTWWRSDGDDGHGIGFQLLANAINKHGQYEITVYHTFHDEVDNFRTHFWQCDGVCKDRPPYFGLVKRSMNRPPGKSDAWWAQHESECGGTYVKIQEPEPTKKQIDAMSKKKRAGLQKSKLDGWLKVGAAKDKSPVEEDNTGSKTESRKRKASTSVPDDIVGQVTAEQRRPRTVLSGGGLFSGEQKHLVDCPICSERIPESSINQHLDEAHFV